MTQPKRSYFKRKIDWSDPAQRRSYKARWTAAKRKGKPLGKAPVWREILGVRVKLGGQL